MAVSKIEVEEREFKIRRNVSVLRVSLDREEIDKILLDNICKHELVKLGLSHREQVEARVKADIHWRSEDFEGFNIEIVFAEEIV